ncbi:MAG: glycosyltransferase [Candidatus Parvarchaeota archaeon]|nr:glycosyltransferase [Candidatus Jingweiarchaeum tengchongense]
MKILIIGSQKPFNAEFFYNKAFNQLGFETDILNMYEHVKYPLFTRIVQTRTSFFHFMQNFIYINKDLDQRVRKIDPDMIIVFKGEFLSIKSLESLSENYKIYLFYPDTFKYKPILKNRLQYYKCVFTAANRTNFYLKFGAKRVVTIPWACDPDFHRKIETIKKYNVSFIGTAYGKRKHVISELDNVATFGDFWGKRINAHPAVYGEEFIQVINETRINLNLHSKADKIADAPNMRTFELAGSGGFQISDYIPSIKRYFPIMVTFHDLTELKELVKFYLDSFEDAKIIAEKVRRIAIENFKYTDSARLIVENM